MFYIWLISARPTIFCYLDFLWYWKLCLVLQYCILILYQGQWPCRILKRHKQCKAALTIPDDANNWEIHTSFHSPCCPVWLPIFSSAQEGLWHHSPLFPCECVIACKWQEIQFCKSCCKFHWPFPLFVTVKSPYLHKHMKLLLDCHVYFLYLLISKFAALCVAPSMCCLLCCLSSSIMAITKGLLGARN